MECLLVGFVARLRTAMAWCGPAGGEGVRIPCRLVARRLELEKIHFIHRVAAFLLAACFVLLLLIDVAVPGRSA